MASDGKTVVDDWSGKADLYAMSAEEKRAFIQEGLGRAIWNRVARGGDATDRPDARQPPSQVRPRWSEAGLADRVRLQHRYRLPSRPRWYSRA